MAKTKLQVRRYYLHSKIKPFCKIHVRQRSIFVTELIMDGFTTRQQNYINELKNKFNYNIQLEIPD